MKLHTVAIAFALTLLAPTVLAAHWTIHESPVDQDASRTREPDGVVVNAPTSSLHGMMNRVTYPGEIAGDGGIFLDARVGNGVGTRRTDPEIESVGPDVYAGAFVGEAFGRPDVLLPGMQHASAWYGWWIDLDDDGVINDVHDAACESGPCPDDEFIWRGIGSGNPVKLVHYQIPGHQNRFHVAQWGLEGDIDGGNSDEGIFLDRTEHSQARQEWVTKFPMVTADGGFLTTIHTLTLANARPAPGTPLGHDLNDPLALLDVDRYESVSADMETLWAGIANDAWNAAFNRTGVTDPFFEPVNALRDEFVPDPFTLTQPVFEITARYGAIASEGYRGTVAWDGKEPNTLEDDFQGRAFSGGVDVWGSFNTYTAYVDSFHLYVDASARLQTCAGVYVEVPATGISASNSPHCNFYSDDATARTEGGRRSTSAILGAEAWVMLWHDRNKDTHVGGVCDPNDAEQFDAERNTCRPEKHIAPYHIIPGDFGEVVPVCDESDAEGGHVTLTPMGANWPGVLIMRDVAETTRVAYDSTKLELRQDDAPIDLRFGTSCITFNLQIKTRDALLIPQSGFPFPVRMETTISLDGFVDHTRGIANGPEYVHDVDILPPKF